MTSSRLSSRQGSSERATPGTFFVAEVHDDYTLMRAYGKGAAMRLAGQLIKAHKPFSVGPTPDGNWEFRVFEENERKQLIGRLAEAPPADGEDTASVRLFIQIAQALGADYVVPAT